jgi:hypothetical protein
VRVTPRSDARAIEIAQAVMARMGGWESWDRTRFVSWRFFGGRQHYWDRENGAIRIESETDDGRWLWLMNVHDGTGRVWRDGTALVADELREALEQGREIWINDSYWVFMPYKLLDPGVTLRHAGQRPLPDGRAADVLELTFEPGVGVTPQNRYEVFVARDSGLVEQWSFFREASDAEPAFSLPWAKWQRFGEILLATDHGQGKDWALAVHAALPASVFDDPAPVSR